jgi:hydroxymethylbilane synthase
MTLQMPKIRIGTRGSPLALYQAHETLGRLKAAHGLADEQLEIVVIATTGDKVRDRPLAEIGGKGLFTKELEEALLAGDIDLAVHSMKDVPAQLAEDFSIAAILPREDARDAFISLSARNPAELKPGARLGSSSVRRTAQLLRTRPDLVAIPFRGNVETRLRKLSEGVADATFLACAGLRRLGLADHITCAMPVEEMLPAVAQGAIGIEIASGNAHIESMLVAINDPSSATTVACERAFLAGLDGSCRTPIAGHAILEGERVSFRGEALTTDGKHCFTAERTGLAADAAALGADAAAEVKAAGGKLLTG